MNAKKNQQFQIRFTEADRILLDQLAKQHNISRADVVSKALSRFESNGSPITIHDHFSGAAHCVECKGFCRLKSDDLALTRMVRYLLEMFTLGGWDSAPDQFRPALEVLLGAKRYQAMWQRAMAATKSVRSRK